MTFTDLRRLATMALFATLLSGCPRTAPPADEPEPIEPVPEVIEVEIDGISARVVHYEATSFELPCPEHVPVVQQIVGETEAGALYMLFRPLSDWNDDLAVYAHGYIPPGHRSVYAEALAEALKPAAWLAGTWRLLEVPDEVHNLIQEMLAPRDELLCANYAVAAALYSADGFSVEEGFVDTHVLGPLFAHHFARPARVLLLGRSMGGIVVTALAEHFPERYAAAMPMCGPVAGSLLQLNYLGNVRLMFDYFAEGIVDIGGDVVTPTDKDFDEIVGLLTAVAQTPRGRAALNNLAQVYVEGLVPGRQVRLLQFDTRNIFTAPDALVRALFYDVAGKAEALDRGGGSPFDNRDVIYWLRDEVLDDVPRYEPDPEATAYFAKWYGSIGELNIPTLLLHDRFDPEVPYFHAERYLELAASRGSSESVVTLQKNRYGHCTFTAAEIVASLSELATAVVPGNIGSEHASQSATPRVRPKVKTGR